MWNVQACWSLDTFADDIAEPAASRVFAMSPFGYGHDPDAIGLVAAGLVTVAGVLVLHAASAKLAVTSRAATRKWRPAESIFI
jgi:hypothetical protein